MVPLSCELIDHDGTILVRFKYDTATKEEAPLLALSRMLDPKQQFSRWDANNPSRHTTVTVALCVIDKDKLKEKLDAIRNQLRMLFEKLQKLGNINISQFQFINHYNKRTLSLKHTSLYANVSQKHIHKI